MTHRNPLCHITSGGRHDAAMLETVAALGVPIVMMHMRGTPQTMTSRKNCAYKTGDCIAEIATGLCCLLPSSILRPPPLFSSLLYFHILSSPFISFPLLSLRILTTTLFSYSKSEEEQRKCCFLII